MPSMRDLFKELIGGNLNYFLTDLGTLIHIGAQCNEHKVVEGGDDCVRLSEAAGKRQIWLTSRASQL